MLVLICFLLQLVAFYLLYNCSARIKLHRKQLGTFLFQHKKLAKTIAVFLLVSSSLVLGISFSTSIAVIVALTSAMTVFSLLIIILPLFSVK